MSWTYTGRPDSSSKDAVRFLIGDTDSTRQLATNEEIEYVLSTNSLVQKAAAIVCRAIAARFSTKASFSVGDVSKSCSDVSKAFSDRAKELEADFNGLACNALPSFGGLSNTNKETLDSDSDAVQPAFKKGMSDNPLARDDFDVERYPYE